MIVELEASRPRMMPGVFFVSFRRHVRSRRETKGQTLKTLGQNPHFLTSSIMVDFRGLPLHGRGGGGALV